MNGARSAPSHDFILENHPIFSLNCIIAVREASKNLQALLAKSKVELRCQVADERYLCAIFQYEEL
jgi:hypothetical protein